MRICKMDISLDINSSAEDTALVKLNSYHRNIKGNLNTLPPSARHGVLLPVKV